MLTVTDVLRRNHSRRPQAPAVVDHAGRLTHRQLSERAWAVGNGLAAAGVRRGDTVAILCGNGIFSAEAILGAMAAGAIAVPLNWRWSRTELEHGLTDSKARVVLADREFAPSVHELVEAGSVPAVRRVIVEGPQYEDFLGPASMPEGTVAPESPAVILYTGGTTGASKGALLSHRNVMANAIDEIVDTDMEPDDITLLIAPMYHSASLLCWFIPHLVIGACSVFMRHFDEERAARLIETERVTNGFFIPNMVRRMLISGAWEKHRMDSFRRLYVGGATFRLPDKQAVRDVLPAARIYYQYGLTEAGPIVTRLRPEDMFDPALDGSIGQEMLLTDVSIQDEDGHELADGTAGEICVRGPNVMLGYFNRPDATAGAFRNGWLRTGDLASRQDGYFMYHDRLKDMIKSGGENVYSAEVEQALYAHPAVAEAAVIGVASDRWDEEVRAVVALKPGRAASERELQDHCRGRIAGYKVPKRIMFLPLDQIPVNPSGKIMKRELRQRPLWPDVVQSR
ncbi:MAG: AMP-binding protein [Candidatus Dormibacteraeota bacterium]|nr:AMP-binding protein [Candidatus Dormibacteraeota bacterium]